MKFSIYVLHLYLHCFHRVLHMLIAALFHIHSIFQLIQFWKLKELVMAQPAQSGFPQEEILPILIHRLLESPKMAIWNTSI